MLYKPEMCVWETTFKCNVNCIHCGSSCTEQARDDELSTAEAIKVIEDLATIGCKHVTLSGGEPFLRKDWDILALKIKQLGMKVTFISNGMLINPEIVKRLVEIKPATVGISLDGGDPLMHDYIRGKEGCFLRVLRAFNLMLDAGLNVSVVTTIQRLNFHHLDKIKDILLLHGVDAWQIQCATPQGRMDIRTAITERQFVEISKFIVKVMRRYKRFTISGADCFGYYGALQPYLHPSGWHGCHAGMWAIGLESNGNVKGCLSLPGDDFIEGNIRERSLIDIWNDPEKFAFNRRFSKDLLSGYCSECTYGGICRGGCTERSYGFHKTFCENNLCLYKFEQKGFSNEIQASICPEPDVTEEIYNSLRPLPEGLRLPREGTLMPG